MRGAVNLAGLVLIVVGAAGVWYSLRQGSTTLPVEGERPQGSGLKPPGNMREESELNSQQKSELSFGGYSEKT